MTSFCNKCSYVWISEFVHNPLADLVSQDQELVNDFETVLDRCGQMLVGNYDLDVEHELFDLLLFAEPGMFIGTSDGLGSSLSQTFKVRIVDGAKPVCHDLRRYNKVKLEFIDKEVKKMQELGVVEPYLGAW